jgi:hypothetical protein
MARGLARRHRCHATDVKLHYRETEREGGRGGEGERGRRGEGDRPSEAAPHRRLSVRLRASGHASHNRRCTLSDLSLSDIWPPSRFLPLGVVGARRCEERESV